MLSQYFAHHKFLVYHPYIEDEKHFFNILGVSDTKITTSPTNKFQPYSTEVELRAYLFVNKYILGLKSLLNEEP